MPLIFDIKRFAIHDGPGIRTTVFFKGCPLRCAWCHNPESISVHMEKFAVKRTIDGKEVQMSRKYGTKISVNELANELIKDEVFFLESGGGVTFSGGEPLMQHASLIELAVALKEKGIHIALDTTGYSNQDVLSRVAEYIDLFLYDLKSLDDKIHRMYTGVGNKTILENADMLLELGKDVVFRIPIVPGINDRDEDITAYIDFFKQRQGTISEVHLLPFHKIGQEKYSRLEQKYSLNHLAEPTEGHIEMIKNKISSSGVNVCVGG